MSTATDSNPTSAPGLIDDLLELRDHPFPKLESDLEVFLDDPRKKSLAWRVHLDAVDAALDLLVPALQRIVHLSSVDKAPMYLHREDVMAIVGHVPKRRNGRYQRD